MLSICEHCRDNLSPTATSAAMNGFVRLGQKGLLVNERMLLFASRVVLTEFHGGTSIEESGLPHPDYALMLICDAESAGGETGLSNYGIASHVTTTRSWSKATMVARCCGTPSTMT